MASTGVARRTLRYAEARERVLGDARALPPENVPLDMALRRALRETIVAPHELPPFRNASMDGFAVRASDLAGATPEHPVELPVAGIVAAGRMASRALAPGEAWRIMTGAAILDGADAVVPFEECEVFESGPQTQRVRFTRAAPPGANIREAGADLRKGDTVFEAGRELSPHDLALLGALGISRVAIGPQPRVGILSTGDELLEIDAPLRPGSIRDSNTLMLRMLLHEAGCIVASMERLSDDPEHVASTIRHVSAQCDVTLTIGGISMGDFDPVRQSLDQMRWVEWWRVAMKPGQPQAFGARGSRLFFGLPGNPASVACVFEALVRPALRAQQGFTELDRPKLTTRAAVAIESRAGRTDFVRVTLESRDGAWWAKPAGAQVSGHLTPQSRAHGLLIVPEAAASLAASDEAETLLLRWPQAEGA